jgi:hypothetical protein
VIIESTEISGTTQFEEVVDPVTIEALEDPIKAKLTELAHRQSDAPDRRRSSL